MRTKYLLLCLSALLLISSSFIDDKFTINGQFTGVADGTKLMLQNLTTGAYLDSSIVKDGRFSFQGSLGDEPEELRIITSVEDLKKGVLHYTDLLIGNENVTISANAADLPLNVNTTGSASQTEAERYNKSLHAKNLHLDSLKKLAKSETDVARKTILETKVKQASSEIEAWKVRFIKHNFNTYIALLQYNYRRDFPTDTLAELYDRLPQKLKNSKYGKAIGIQVKYPKPKVGEMYTNFNALDADGKSTSVSDIKGKYTVLQFAGTGCYGSEQSIANIKKIKNNYAGNVSFISYYIDGDKNSWMSSVKHKGIDWPTLWDTGGKYSVPANKYGITGTPTFFIISPEGKIVSTWFGYDQGIIERELKKVMQ